MDEKDRKILKLLQGNARRTYQEIMARLFAYQYEQLKPERRDAYLLEIVLLNIDRS